MLNQPPFPHFADLFFLLCKEKRAEWLPDIHSSSTERGKRVQEPAGLLDGENGGVSGVSVFEENLSTCPSLHSRTFQGAHRQSMVRGPGTDPGPAVNNRSL